MPKVAADAKIRCAYLPGTCRESLPE